MNMRDLLREKLIINKMRMKLQILVRLSFRELCNLLLSGLGTLDTIAISLSKKNETKNRKVCC